ncbi:bifunctional DNA-formamidopyrimidine glycosylase/DNA-(apurinic or apyrimidinic site) lyase [Planctomyces sp. SH-PL62]|uniref:bifunctional DNA-formamidopyrimidine glycosylase/DNA-(apurinic or apyrimidinic site) lyase n=1 Tax=Planctomyces sp. SH-PL62 TaxID=1636152 RepID=UPI00078C1873|nr:bifunctional DNA-formamidopyrimidine glycosylase/DNA-(apurinic or apyrimidinic site) lyase [Planctomyces sp. SH-PL62]AMV38044.1 Formamidopyrimidine-DNA glycosylase [Planctomyces sp. SH-PL62]
MPELPEVETMVRGLRPALEGRTVDRMELHDPSLLQGCTAEEFAARGVGVRVARVGRRGKWVVVELADRGMIVIQPRMTGGFWLVDPPRPEHVRLTFRLANPEASIWFCDARRLGRIIRFDGPEDAEAAFARAHGPDALTIARDDLAARLKRTRRGIKPTLMDQKVLAGIGNIYADEILFQSRLHPLQVSAELTAREVDRLHAAIEPVLARAIAAEGSSFDAGYRTVLGLEGGFLAVNSMYGRAGEPCKGCGTPVQKTKIAGLIGRPTYLCPTCQPFRKPRSRKSTT